MEIKKMLDAQYGALTQYDCHRPVMSSCLYFSKSHFKVLYIDSLLK